MHRTSNGQQRISKRRVVAAIGIRSQLYSMCIAPHWLKGCVPKKKTVNPMFFRNSWVQIVKLLSCLVEALRSQKRSKLNYLGTIKGLGRKGSLQWRYNERDGVWNHQPHDCTRSRLFRRRSAETSKLCVTCLCGEFTGDQWIPRTTGQ